MAVTKGRYDLQFEVGRGAAGTVWRAWDTKLERRVAVKLLHADLPCGEEALKRFEQEARTVARLHSPHVVRVYDVGVDKGQPFMVTELLEGESLEARLGRHGKLPLSIAVTIASSICRGLRAIHRAGVVHRDVKPANVFLAIESGREVVKLLDFGVANGAVHDSSTRRESAARTQAVIGTPLFMSPEQLGGQPPNEGSDLWSLAVCLYRMLTGEFPFSGTTIPSLAGQMTNEVYRPPSAALSERAAEVDQFFRRALAGSEKKRFASADEFSDALKALGAESSSVTRILFIDDEPDMELLLRQRFRHQVRSGSYELLYAPDGQAGLDLLRCRPDINVVVTDLNMPAMDGLTFLAKVPDVNAFVRTIVVSAYDDMANIRTAMNRGSFDFLGKPIDFEDLERTIEKCAAHVEVVRRAMHSSEENELMRILLGQGVTDRWLNAFRTDDSPASHVGAATVVFVDVYGFARTLHEPFSTHALEDLNTFLALFSRELQSKGGRIVRFIGDAVFAIFEGENHTTRSVEACLAIRSIVVEQSNNPGSSALLGLGIAVGIDAGVVLSGAVGSRELGHVEPSVLGETVGTAARLQGLATRNEILISAAVSEKLPEAFQYELDDTRRVSITGKSYPVISLIRKRPSSGTGHRDEETLAGPIAAS